MKTFKIPVSWEMYGYVRIDAETIDEAIEKAWGDDIDLPDDGGEYVDASWQVDEDIAREIN